MKLHHYLLLGGAFIASFTSCKHPTDPIVPGGPDSTTVVIPDHSGTVTEVGQPQGTATSKVIGPEGGSISAEGGKVQLVIPAGAVSKATDISIQPITNKNSTGLGVAYRFLPEGLQFSKPATLTFQYDEKKISSKQPENLRIAYQRNDGVWYQVTGSSVNMSKHEVTVPMEHFSDWTPYEESQLNFTQIGSNTGSGAEYVPLGGTIELYAVLNTEDPNYPKSAKEKPLKAKRGLGKNWQLIGEGKLNPELTGATYTAPTTVPKQNPVLVTADIEFEGKPFKVTLICQIYVGDGTFFNILINNAEYKGHSFSCSRIDGQIYIGCGAGVNQMYFRLNTNELAERYYKFDNEERPNTAMLAFKPTDDPLNGHGFLCAYVNCSNETITSPGQVSIDKIEIVNGVTYVTGSVIATGYQTHGVCNKDWSLEKVTLTGSFRMLYLDLK
ncbi:hypothetical protein [Spirosoma flavus]